MKMSKNKNAPSESICNPLSFSFFSFQFFLRQYAFEVHGTAQSIISYYLPKTGLGILDRKKGHNAGYSCLTLCSVIGLN